MEFFVYFCGIAVVFLWAKTRIDTLEAANAERDRRIAQLTERLFTLEQRGVESVGLRRLPRDVVRARADLHGRAERRHLEPAREELVVGG